jgi:predicted deacylase
MSATRIVATIDFEREGRQTGFLRLPHSVHESAYGFIPIPIVQLKGGSGPTVLLNAGNHGDEYEGQVTLMKLIRTLEPKDVAGRIIFTPASNFPAANAGRRTSPIDGGNLNRSFPGDPDGTPTKMIAHYYDSVVLPMCDYVLDLHSGGSSLMYLPSALGGIVADNPERNAKTLELLRVFGAPISFVSKRAAQTMGGDRTLTSSAERLGAMTLGTEAGGGGTVTPSALKVAEDGVRRVLKHIGVVPKIATEPPPSTRLMEIGGPDYFVYATENGLYEPLVELGQEIKAGQPAAAIHFIPTPWREPEIVRFERAGTVLCKRIPGRTERGDCLFHLGTDYQG